MKHTRQLLLLAALSCALFSCSSKLNKEEASDIIIKHYDFPNVEIMRIHPVAQNDHLNKGEFGALEIGQESDLMETYMHDYGSYTIRKGRLSEKGRQFLAPASACEQKLGEIPAHAHLRVIECVASNMWEFKQVSGISDNETDNTAIVEYIVSAKGVNTFGMYTGKTEGMEQTRKVTMRRYDDGSWRIEDAKPTTIVKPADISYYAQEKQAK